ncbi:MAG: hypothetical protein LPK45_00865 [Bacteroidota bacterium]|nr:hypothetical protein [Bacteroidota bacterium]MDX5429579.1 hypothetical protein [Bacteroidota bacterium]MDX5468363.1 hypothetical protein [Bacteroidota bacterium]
MKISKMRTLLASLFVCFSIWSQAQNVKYKAESFNNTLSPFKLSLNITGYRYVINPTVGLTAEGIVSNRIGYHAQFLYGPTLLFRPKEVLNDATDTRKKDYYTEAGIDWILHSRTKDDAGKIKVNTGSDGAYDHYFIARVDLRKTFGIRAGLLRYNAEARFDQQVIDPNLPVSETKLFQNYSMTGGYAGLAFRKIKKAKITSDGWVYYKNYQRIFYMDVMLAGVSGQELNFKSTTYNPDIQKDAIGYRMGFKWDQMGTTTTWEFGKQPGPRTDEGPAFAEFYNYMTLGFAFNLYGGDKRYGMKQKK